jgi:ankyrin repeat protein
MGNLYVLTIAIMSGTNEIIDLLMSSGACMDKTVEEATHKRIDDSLAMIEKIQNSFDYAKNNIAALPAPVKQVVKISGSELRQQFMTALGNMMGGDSAELKKLIDQGADVNTAFVLGKSETTPLCLAVGLNNKEAIDMLVNAGAVFSIEIINEHGKKELLEEKMKREIAQSREEIIKCRERLAYALSKAKRA